MISDKQALIYGYNCPIVRVDFDLRSGKSTMKQLKERKIGKSNSRRALP